MLDIVVMMSIMLGLSMFASLLLEPKVRAGSRFDLTGTRCAEAAKCLYCGVATVAFDDSGNQVNYDRCQKCGAWR